MLRRFISGIVCICISSLLYIISMILLLTLSDSSRVFLLLGLLSSTHWLLLLFLLVVLDDVDFFHINLFIFSKFFQLLLSHLYFSLIFVRWIFLSFDFNLLLLFFNFNRCLIMIFDNFRFLRYFAILIDFISNRKALILKLVSIPIHFAEWRSFCLWHISFIN